jgi:hypothetical protein
VCTWAQLCTVRTSHAVPAPFRCASPYVFLNRQVNLDVEGPAKASGFRRANNRLIVGGYLMSSQSDQRPAPAKSDARFQVSQNFNL